MHRLTGNVETIIIEYAFMDHRADHDWYLNDQNFYKAAESVVEEICKYIGIQYRGPKSSDQPKVDLPIVSGTLFRVQVGAFGKLENAERLQERLEAADIDTYLIQDQGLFKVQVGAYRKKENAEAQAKRVEAKGFDTFITTASGTPAHGTKDEPTQPAAVVTPSTSVSRSVNAGDKVILNNSANRYATGQTIPASVKNRTYTVMQTRPGQVLLQEIMSWVHVADVRLSSAASAIESGDRVTLNSNASRYATGEKIPASRKGQRYTVLQTRSGQVLLREILSWVHTRDVTKL